MKAVSREIARHFTGEKRLLLEMLYQSAREHDPSMLVSPTSADLLDLAFEEGFSERFFKGVENEEYAEPLIRRRKELEHEATRTGTGHGGEDESVEGWGTAYLQQASNEGDKMAHAFGLDSNADLLADYNLVERMVKA